MLASLLGSKSPLLLSTPVKRVSETGVAQQAILLVTPEKLYLLDLETNTLQQHFSINEYSLEKNNTHTGPQEEVSLHIVTKFPRAETPQFRQVEYFLELSKKTQEDANLEFSVPLLKPASPTLEVSDEDEAERGVELHMETHRAVQLVSLVHHLSLLLEQPDTVFTVHHISKSESFTAKTSF